MIHRFLPVICPWIIRHHLYSGVPDDTRSRELTWLNKEQPFLYHPGTLISYEYRGVSNEAENEGWSYQKCITKYIGDAGIDPKNKEPVIFGDSGGFGVARRQLAFDPVEVIEWQSRRCNRGVILDIPPFKYTGGASVAGSASQLWGVGLGRTVETVKRGLSFYEKNRETRPFFRWWGAVHGQSLDQMAAWHKAVQDVYPFTDEGEGWAFAPKAKGFPRSFMLARQLRFAIDAGIKRIHFLQVTSARELGIVFALNQLEGNPIEEITYDSAAASMHGKNMSIYHPNQKMYSLKQTYLHYQVEKPEYYSGVPRNGFRYRWDQCNCPSCGWFLEDSGMTADEVTRFEFKEKWRTPFVWYIMLHNVLVMRKQFERVFKEAQDDADGVLRRATSDASEYGKIKRIFYNESTKEFAPQGKVVSVLEAIRSKNAKPE